MILTNNHNLPQPIVDALSRDDYNPGPTSTRSITDLINPPRIRILRREHDHERTEDVSDKVWAVLGSAVHKVFEGEDDETHISEQRVQIEHSGWNISGQPDLQTLHIDRMAMEINDYKCTSVWSVIYGKEDWVQQLNGYRWLLSYAKPDVPVDQLTITAILRDWNWREQQKRPREYPQSPIMSIDIPLWPLDQAEAFFTQRIALHQEAEFQRLTSEDLPLCSDEERWAKAGKYAVKKGKTVKAIRVLNSMEEAMDYIQDKKLDDKHWVEHRPGEAIRCDRNYCGVADFCEQYQGVKK